MSDIRAQSKRDAEFDRLLSDRWLGDNEYRSRMYSEQAVADAYEMGDRHRAEQCPRWHDAPTCAGLWVRRCWWDDADCEPYDVDRLHWLVMTEDGLREANGTAKPRAIYQSSNAQYRWFGPIPEVKP